MTISKRITIIKRIIPTIDIAKSECPFPTIKEYKKRSELKGMEPREPYAVEW